MKKKTLAVLAASGIMLTSLTGCQNLIQNDPVTCTVDDKDRSTNSEGASVYRIYTSDCGEDNATLGLADNILAGNFNSSDMYGQIKVGATYEFKTVGARNGFLSMFREITEMELISEAP